MRTVSVLTCFLVLALVASVDAHACGTERWPVKVGDDPDAVTVDLRKIVPTTIVALDDLPPPSERPEAARIRDAETTVYALEAMLTAYKLETDGDYHLVLADGAGHTLIAEIPDPACVGTESPFVAGIRNARAEFDARLKVRRRFRRAAIRVKVIGVGFFDFEHHQRGVAPNAIEIHPVLDIAFL